MTAAAASKSFGTYQDAAVRAPVIITKNGRPRTVLIAYEDYVRLAARDRRVELTSQLSDADITAVERAEMEPGLDHLNAELDGKTIKGADAAGQGKADPVPSCAQVSRLAGSEASARSVLAPVPERTIEGSGEPMQSGGV